MKKSYLSLVFLILISGNGLLAQMGSFIPGALRKPDTGLSGYRCQISGLSSMADRSFFIVRTYGSSQSLSFTVSPIGGDVVSLPDLRRPTGNSKVGTFLSWDPLLARLESNREYFAQELSPPVPVIGAERYYLPLTNPFTERFKYFSIEDSCRLEVSGMPGPAPEFQLVLRQREYLHPGFRIKVYGGFEKIPQFLYSRLREHLLSSRGLRQDDMAALVAFSQQQENHSVAIIDPAYGQDIEARPVNRYRDLFSLRRLYLGILFIPILTFCVLIEFLVTLLLLKPVSGIRLRSFADWARALGACAVANLATGFVAWWLLPSLIPGVWLFLALTGAISLLFEALVLSIILRLHYRQALLISLVGNLITLGTLTGFFAWV
jgi:hypothetical protein